MVKSNSTIEDALNRSLKDASDYKYALEESSIVTITDQQGIITYANDNFCKISGYNRKELIGRDHRIINSGHHSKDFIHTLWTTIANGKIWRGELKNKAKDDTYYWVDTTIVPFINEEGKPYQYVAIRADITGRKLAEDKLIKVLRKEEVALNRISDAVVSLDNDWRYTFLNDAALATNPLGRQETLGKVIWDVHPEMKETIFWDKYHEAMLTKNTVEIESYYSPMNLWFSVKIYPSSDGLTIFYRDDTKRKENEKIQKATKDLVAQNEKRFRALIEKSTDLVTLSSQDGEMLYASPSITKVLGYPLEEFLHNPSFGFVHPDDIPRFVEKRNEILTAPDKSMFIQVRFRHKKGDWIWCEGTITNMLHEPGIKALVSNFKDISEKKKAKQQSEFDKNNFNALINNTEDLMWSVDRDTRLITFNQPFYDTIKFVSGKEIAKGDDVFSVVLSQEQSDHFKISYARAFAGETFTEIDHIKTPVDFYSEISYYPIRKGNEVIGTACHSRNITERKKVEANLIKSESRLKEAQAIAHLGNWELNLATGEAFWSEEARKIYGLSPEENQTYESWVSFIHPEDLADVMEATNNSQKNLSGTNLNHRIILKDGTIKHVHAESKFVLDQQGKPVGLYGITHDVTKEKIAENQREFDRNNLSALINNTRDLLWSVDKDLKLITSNQPFDEITKLMSGQAIEKGSNILSTGFSPGQLIRYKKFYERAFAGETFTEIEHTETPVDFWSEISFYPIRKGNEVIGTACHSHDITPRKLAEIERTKMVNELVLRNKDLDQFSYIVSHNLRAPVANILGTTSELNDPELSAEEKDILSQGLAESVTRLDGVIKDLSHILQVKHEIRETKELVHFSELSETIITKVKNLTDSTNIEISYNFAEVDKFLTLKSYLHNIFYNLITNSIKYRQPKIPGIIEIKSHIVNNGVELIFKDNGMGIDLAKKGDQVFGLYKRFHPAIEGKGMGLFMVKTQVEMLGGKISITSEVNKGTEFKIRFER